MVTAVITQVEWVFAEEGGKLYSYLLNGAHNPDPQQQHNLLPHHSKANYRKMQRRRDASKHQRPSPRNPTTHNGALTQKYK